MSEDQPEFVSQPNFVVVTQDMVENGGYPEHLLGTKVIDGWTQPPEPTINETTP
jgi:hypothetical protein